jgi:hypothetical protein
MSDRIDGYFTEVTYGKIFDYRKGPETEYDRKQGATHVVYVRPSASVPHGRLPAIVKKTVAYIAVDEDFQGNYKWEKWNIRNHWPMKEPYYTGRYTMYTR